MSDFLMPSLGADMQDGTVIEWLKEPGETVRSGEVLAVVETVKGAIEIEYFDDGVLESIVAPPGTTVPVGAVLARMIDRQSETSGGPPGVPAPIPTIASPEETAPAKGKQAVRVSPAARKRSAELNLDITTLAPGRDGIIGLSEVEALQAYTRTASKPGFDPAAMRLAIGAAMSRSKREIPHYYVTSTLDISPFLEWLENANREREVQKRILYAAPLIKAIGLALKNAPTLNGFYKDGRYRPSERVHVGVATALRGGGLIAPAMHDTDTLAPDVVMARLRDLVARVRTGRLKGSELTDPTVTISILGEGTADSLQPVIYPPQVSIIGCGAIRERPWAVNGSIGLRRTMTVTVAGDHRVSDGRDAGRFLNRLEKILREPITL